MIFLLSSDHQMWFKKGKSCSYTIYFAKLSITIPLMAQLLVYVLLICIKHLTKLTIPFCYEQKCSSQFTYSFYIGLLIHCLVDGVQTHLHYVWQGGALSPCLYALYVNDVIIMVTSCVIGCHFGFAYMNIVAICWLVALIDIRHRFRAEANLNLWLL